MNDAITGLPSELIVEATAWRRHLHQYPELGYNEHKTADFIASALDRAGLSVHRGLAGTGVVGVLRRGTSRRAIGIRAEMDALPIQEESGAPYASANPGIMHACGHDGHMAIALAAATHCAGLPGLDGTVYFIFQPAEENEGGGRRMVEEGLFRLFPCDAIYALHNWPALSVGTCVVPDGALLAAFAIFEIRIAGRGGHAAMPHDVADPILAGCELVSALQSIVSRNIDPRQAAVVSATQFAAGRTWNIIPDCCVIRGTTRWFEDRVGDTIERRMRDLSTSIAAAFGCTSEVRYERRYPAAINDPRAAGFIRSVAVAPPLTLALADTGPSTGSDDFAFMLKAVPGCYLLLGAARPGRNPGLHSPGFDFNDELIPTGVALWATIVGKSLGNSANSSTGLPNRPVDSH